MPALTLTTASRTTDKLNNYSYIYRVEHENVYYSALKDKIGYGPYTYINSCAHLYGNKDNRVSRLKQVLSKFEPRMMRFGRDDICVGKILPASYSWIRPGPREDPLLRDWFKNTYLNGDANAKYYSKDVGNDPVLFCFDSEDQFRRWFFDNEELQLLEQHGFKIVKRRVKSNTVVRGFAQALWRVKDLLKNNS